MTDMLTERWIELHKKGGYGSIGYSDLVVSMGFLIVEEKTFGSYQGDIAFIVEGEDGRRGEMPDPRRSQLDRQRQSVEAPADLGYDG